MRRRRGAIAPRRRGGGRGGGGHGGFRRAPGLHRGPGARHRPGRRRARGGGRPAGRFRAAIPQKRQRGQRAGGGGGGSPSRPPWLQALAQELPLRGLGPPRSPPRPCPTPRRGVGGGGAPPSFRVGGARRPRRPRPGRVRGVGIGCGPPQGRGGDAGAAAEAQAAQGSGNGASGASEAAGCCSPVQVPAEPVPPEVLRVLRARDVLLGGVRLLGLPQPGGVRGGGSERHRERQETVPGTVRVRRQDCPAGRGRGTVGAPAGVQVPAEFMPEALLRVLRGGGGVR